MTDLFTRFKLFYRNTIVDIESVSDRFNLEYGIVIKLIISGHIPREIPVNNRSRSFKQRNKIKLFRDPITRVKALYVFGIRKNV